MTNNTENIVNFLKEIISKNGKTYLEDNPYEVYKELLKSNTCDRKTAASLLHLLVCFESENYLKIKDKEIWSKLIQNDCFFKKSMADYFAEIMLSLYSKDNEIEWKNNELKGLKEFLSEEFNYLWHGLSIWEYSNVFCESYFNAEIVLKPTNKIKEDKTISLELKKNIFLKSDFIYDYFTKKLKKCLDDDFEEYCNSDDYYPPSAEDYCGNLEDTLQNWCEENGFELVSCEGEGETGNYEPKSKYIRYR